MIPLFQNKYILFLISIALFTSCSSDDNGTNCPQVDDIYFNTSATSINISYYSGSENGANSFKIEYGPSGFLIGNGTTITTSNNNFEISGLTPSTTYDVYIISICSSQDQSSPTSLLSVTTDQSICSGVPNVYIDQTDLNRITLSYSFEGGNNVGFEIEYGLAGFTLGTGTIITVNSSTGNTYITQFEPDTTYDFYVRANCSSSGNDFSAYAFEQYTSISYCSKPFDLNATYISGSCDVNNLYIYSFNWIYYSNSNAISYTISLPDFGESPNTGSQFTTSNTSINIQGFFCTEDDFYVRVNCNDGSTSEWAGPVTF